LFYYCVFITGWREALFALPRRLFGGTEDGTAEGDITGADGQVRDNSPKYTIHRKQMTLSETHLKIKIGCKYTIDIIEAG
jgi:hypothetical protein